MELYSVLGFLAWDQLCTVPLNVFVIPNNKSFYCLRIQRVSILASDCWACFLEEFLFWRMVVREHALFFSLFSFLDENSYVALYMPYKNCISLIELL
jgi:hypothetical protein